jgi:Ran GTPase-activating protein (RanGAP) involved in mRNA processing and transport
MERLFTSLQRVRENDPNTSELRVDFPRMIQHMTPEEWEQIGQAIANNTHLTSIVLWKGALNEQKVLSLFRGLTRSNSITCVNLSHSGLSVAGVQSMMTFLQNANNLVQLCLDENNIQSEGINVLFRALRDSPIEHLSCYNCGIESIEIDRNNMPQRLKSLHFSGNNINADGCRGLATLLQGRDSTLEKLYLDNNNIDDEGVAILVDALQSNTSLNVLYLKNNEGISVEGVKLFLRLVNDISSINATLQSNHTLEYLYVQVEEVDHDVNGRIRQHIANALEVNRKYSYENELEAAGREKVIQTQLHSVTRAELANLQGVDHSVFSEIDPLHLPEVLALIGERHGQGELYVALRSSMGRIDFLA